MVTEDNALIGAGCAIVFIWIIGALLSLATSVAVIYFLIQAASGNVF